MKIAFAAAYFYPSNDYICHSKVALGK